MDIFSRFRQNSIQEEQPESQEQYFDLPEINDRIMIVSAGHNPQPSRIEDDDSDEIVIASPNIPLDMDDHIVLTWERDEGWYSFETRVTGVQNNVRRPAIRVSKAGFVQFNGDDRRSMRKKARLPLELRIIMSRAVKPGHVLHTQCVELSASAIRFATSAPFAPGDIVEATLTLGPTETLSMRVKVVRVDTHATSWKQEVSAVFDEILQSDRSRIIRHLEDGKNLNV